MQQIWAEVLTLFRAGEQWWLTGEESKALETVNAEHETVDPIEERIITLFAWDRPHTRNVMTATEVLLAIGHDKPSKTQRHSASAILQKLSGKKPRKSHGQRVFDLPPKQSEIDDMEIPY